MKNQLFFFISVFILIANPFIEIKAQNLPEVISIREIVMSDEINEIIFLNYYNQWCDKVHEHSKGVNGWVMKGDRGERIGEYVSAWAYDYKSTRDYYFPESDWSNYPQWNAMLNKFQFHAPEQALLKSTKPSSDFVVLGFSKIIAPQLGEIIGVRYFDIEESKQAEFELFIENEYHQAYQKNIDGFYNYILKADRGAKTGSYLLLTVFDSADRRNLYYPVPEGQGSEEFHVQWLKLQDVDEKFNKCLGKTIEEHYTDYIVAW